MASYRRSLLLGVFELIPIFLTMLQQDLPRFQTIVWRFVERVKNKNAGSRNTIFLRCFQYRT